MLKKDEIIKRLKDRNLSEVARQTGLARGTVWNIVSGNRHQTLYENIEKLSNYLERNP